VFSQVNQPPITAHPEPGNRKRPENAPTSISGRLRPADRPAQDNATKKAPPCPMPAPRLVRCTSLDGSKPVETQHRTVCRTVSVPRPAQPTQLPHTRRPREAPSPGMSSSSPARSNKTPGSASERAEPTTVRDESRRCALQLLLLRDSHAATAARSSGSRWPIRASAGSIPRRARICGRCRRALATAASGGVLTVVGIARTSRPKDVLLHTAGAVQHRWMARKHGFWEHTALGWPLHGCAAQTAHGW
jgi:hypothetical protein